jgi:hypothetical protein
LSTLKRRWHSRRHREDIGKYKLVLISPGGAALTRIADDVNPF